MASDVVHDAIKTYLVSAWTTTTIAWENELFDRPEPPAPWIAIEMSGDLYAQQSIGEPTQADNRWDEEGELWLHVFVPVNTGASLARRYAKSLVDLFRGKTLLSGDLEFMDGAIGAGQVGDELGVYFRISGRVDWRRMEA